MKPLLVADLEHCVKLSFKKDGENIVY